MVYTRYIMILILICTNKHVLVTVRALFSEFVYPIMLRSGYATYMVIYVTLFVSPAQCSS